MNDSIQKNILRELRMIKRILAHSMVADTNQTAQISKLNDVGFQQKEIAEILGTTSNTVGVTLNRLKKAKQKNNSKKKK